jgi:hypothetical protein
MDKHLKAFVEEVTATLLSGEPHRTPGFGTFSTCTRRATAGRASSTMAVFRAGAELRAYASGGPRPKVPGPHAHVVSGIVKGMQRRGGIEIPRLGRMAVVPVPGGKPRLIFHSADELNELLVS